jgi:hypothetical protein
VRLRRSVALFLILLPSLLVLWRLVLLEPPKALSRGAIQGVFSLLPFLQPFTTTMEEPVAGAVSVKSAT